MRMDRSREKAPGAPFLPQHFNSTDGRQLLHQQISKSMASAWLENSNDPIDGNNKKIEKYWDDIAACYNSTTPSI
ncbi:hypothetical protein BRADI_3g38169v3 [Brachypodium distachyon]|uniref:Uncharacterized protein n=1 Tax=Brachypodium distachyon TaxID=15368 RepID=A0A2K2D1X5_BRADI|nr:hypothetical protein BRADI_3g38169v3 [Brachypodium distachyon]